MENQSKKKLMRTFGLTTMAVNNRTTVFVLTFFILIAGIMAYTSMPKENFPEVITPEIYVGTPYPGNSPLDIEKLITRPLEKSINSISGIDKITSTSIQGYSTVMVKFDFSVSPSEALRKVKDKVDIAKSDPDFPTDLPADPNVFEMNFSELIPVMNINLSGPFSSDQLKEYGEYLEDEIEKLPQISKVEIRGVQEKEVRVDIDVYKMQSMELAFGDIERSIQMENVTISGGDLKIDGMRRTVRVEGEFQSIEDIADIIVKNEKFQIVHLRDIADISFVEEERTSYAREFTNPVVSVDVIKRAGENLLSASDSINKIVDYAVAQVFPENLNVSVTNDQSDMTRTQVGELENSIIFGVLLVVGVLLFFLGLRNAIFVGVAIPLSMFMAFMILGAFGVTLNVMVLFSLVLALGMLVDNGIVVVENIYRLMDEGYSAKDAAIYGVGEVAWPIIASTATTLAAFFPLLIWPGLMGEFMKFLPITLIIVLGSSLFVALVINPALTAVFMRVGEDHLNKKRALLMSAIFIGLSLMMYAGDSLSLPNLFMAFGLLGLLNLYVLTPATAKFQTKVIPVLENLYKRFVAVAINGWTSVGLIVGMVVLFVISVILLANFPPKVEFFPVNEPRYANVFIQLPIGKDMPESDMITKEIEATLIDLLSEYNDTTYVDGEQVIDNFLIESIMGNVGEGTSDPMQGPAFGTTPHKGKVTVAFVPFHKRRGVSTSDVLEDIRAAISDYPGVLVTVDKDAAGPPMGKPINLELTGDNYDELMAEALKIKRFIDDKGISGIEDLQPDVEIGKPEMPVTIDRAKANRLNVSTMSIGMALRTALFGKEVSNYKDGEEEYPIVLRFNEEHRHSKEALMDQLITFRDQMTGKIVQVPISAVASSSNASTFSAVKRKDLKRVVTLQSNVLGDYNPNEVVQKMKDELADYELPKGITSKFTGQQEEQAKEMAFLANALLIAVFLIMLIIVAQFNSISTPIIIGLSIFFSLIGVQLGLVIFQMDFVIIMTMIGVISLAGVVVNNAIVLIDYTNLVADRMKEKLGLGEKDFLPFDQMKAAVIEGGKTRLRPVLLTAITTILGLLPLAVGLNIDFFTLFSEFDPNIYVGGDNVIFWGPMSWTIIFGLTFATFLTLVIVPVIYLLLIRIKYMIKGRYKNRYSLEK